MLVLKHRNKKTALAAASAMIHNLLDAQSSPTTGAVSKVRSAAVFRNIHIHFFVSGHYDFVLDQWIRALKRTLSKEINSPRPHWQDGFFDHIIRHEESHSEKWEYVCQNPVRAGLVKRAEDWPFQGEIESIDVL